MNRNTDALARALQKKIEEKGCTGVAVCIRGPEGVWFEKGFGKRSVKQDLPVLPDTVFGIASLSKSFTALSLCILHAEGKLNLDEPAVKYLPDLHIPGVPDELVTLRQLALHRAGIPFNECLDWSIAMNTPGEYYQNDDYLRRMSPYQFDKIEDIMSCGLWAGRLLFTTESPRECVMVTKAYQGLSDYRPNGLTRGLYYRGVE